MTPNIKYVISETIKICKELMFRNNRFNESKSRRQKSISERVLRESLTSLISISKIYEARGNINPLLNSIKFGDNLKELYDLSFGAEDPESGRMDFGANSDEEKSFLYDAEKTNYMSDLDKEFLKGANDFVNKVEKNIEIEDIDELLEIINEFFDYFTDDEINEINECEEKYDVEGMVAILREKIEELNDRTKEIEDKAKKELDKNINSVRKQRNKIIDEQNKKITSKFIRMLNTVNSDEEVNNFLLIRGYDTDEYKYMGSTILINLVQYGLSDALDYVLTEWLPNKIRESVLAKRDEIVENCIEENVDINNIVKALEEEINQIKYEMNEIELSSKEHSEYETRLNWLIKLLKFTKVPCDINLELLNISNIDDEDENQTGITAFGMSWKNTTKSFELSRKSFDEFINQVSSILDDKTINISDYTSDNFSLLRSTDYNDRNTKKLWTILEQAWQNYDMSDYEGENYRKNDLDEILSASKLYKFFKLIPSGKQTRLFKKYKLFIDDIRNDVKKINDMKKQQDYIEENRESIEKNIEENELLVLDLEERKLNEKRKEIARNLEKKIKSIQKEIEEDKKTLEKSKLIDKTILVLRNGISKSEKEIIESFDKLLKENNKITVERRSQLLDEIEEIIYDKIWNG